MAKLPRFTAAEAEQMLLRAGLEHLRSKGSHRVYGIAQLRVTVPFHSGATLHPKIVKQVLEISKRLKTSQVSIFRFERPLLLHNAVQDSQIRGMNIRCIGT